MQQERRSFEAEKEVQHAGTLVKVLIRAVRQFRDVVHLSSTSSRSTASSQYTAVQVYCKHTEKVNLEERQHFSLNALAGLHWNDDDDESCRCPLFALGDTHMLYRCYIYISPLPSNKPRKAKALCADLDDTDNKLPYRTSFVDFPRPRVPYHPSIQY